MYALGGRGFGPRADLISYDIASNSWTALASMPTPRAGLGAAVFGDAIYAIGGRARTGRPASGGALAVVELMTSMRIPGPQWLRFRSHVPTPQR